MKSTPVNIRLRAHCHKTGGQNYVVIETEKWIEFGREDSARPFTRQQAAKVLRRLRSWGRYYYGEAA